MIKTKRLELVRFDRKYAKDLFELWGDYEVIKYTYMPQLKSIDECSEKIEMFINYTDDEIVNNFIILSDGKAIGIIGSPIIDKDKAVFGLYYQLMRKYWSKGYISEAVEAFRNYILSKFPNAEFHAEVVCENSASEAILRKMGFVEVGVEKIGFTLNGFTLDITKFINQN